MDQPEQKRGPPAGGGSRKGKPNKATAHAREAIGRFVDSKSELLDELLEEIRQKEGPLATWNCIMDLVEYHVPKLQRTEIQGELGLRGTLIISD